MPWSLELASDPSSLAQARSFVAQKAREAGFGDDRVFDIAVAGSEATANAIEHATGDEPVRLTALLHSDRLELDVAIVAIEIADLGSRRKIG